MRAFFCLLLIAVFSCSVCAKLDVPFNVDHNVVIDGHISDKEWSHANRIDVNNVMRPFNNLPAPVNTTVSFFEDGQQLYILFEAYDSSPNDIQARLVDRDLIWGDDIVGVKIDTFNDGRLAYQFFANALGIQSDAIQNEMTGNESDSWNTIWQSQGKITEDGYIVEFAIPLSTMNFSQSDADKTWGVEFVRFYPREDMYRISHIQYDRNNACDLCQMMPVTGFAKAEQGKALELVPTIIGGYSQTREVSPTSDWVGERGQELGLDINWGITPEISLQGTLNPDFSQVESDSAQVSVNNTFALFFPEKRPFFVENADYFTSMLNLIYTRNINAPEYGIKLTGRLGQHSLGVFFANDETTNFLVPGNLGSRVSTLENKSNNMALRYRYDVNKDLSLGIVSTLREADDYHNYVLGFDSKWTPTDADNIRIQYVHSDTEYPQDLYQQFCEDELCNERDAFSEAALRTQYGDSIGGGAFRLEYRRDTEHYFIRVGHFDHEADFRGDLGFVSRVDRRTSVIGGGYVWRSEEAWWNRLRLRGDWDIHHDDNGDLLEKEIEAFFSIDAKYDTYIDFGQTRRQRVGLRHDASVLTIASNTTLFDEYFNRLIIETRPTADLELFQRFSQGEQIDFANNRVGDRFVSESSLEYQFNRHLKLNAGYEYVELDASGANVFTAKVLQGRATYQFDAKQFVRLIVDVSEVERNVDNYIDDVTPYYKDMGVQLLYSYKVNPLTKFFLGYSDAGFQDETMERLTSNERSVFFKISFAYTQ